MPFYLKKGDLVAANVDAIVNASNVNLKMVEGVGRAIFHKAGDVELTKACKAIGNCKVGHAVITPSFNMKNCKAIIHAVAPIYINGKHDEAKNLRAAYKSSLQICLDNGFKSVAFPLLSGEFNYPLVDAYEVAQEVFVEFLKEHKDFAIYMIIFKNFPDLLDESTHDELKNFIIGNFNASQTDAIKDNNEMFVELLNKYLVEKELDKGELVDLSNVHPNVLTNIYTNKNYIPSKNIVLSLAIGLKLNENETISLLKTLGYNSLFNNVTSMVSIFFIRKQIYDIYKINTALFNYEVQPLGLE